VTSLTSVFVDGVDISPPSGLADGPLQRVIEHTNNVIIANGDLDMALPTNGTLLALQNLTWNGAQGFSQPPNHPLWIPKAEE
jgi:carboxypeptidase D